MEIVNDCLTKYYPGHLTSEYLTDLPQNIRTLLQQAEKRFQNGDLTFIKELAQKVLSVLERPARSSERLETAEGETEDGQNLHPEIISDPNMGQRELTSDLITDTSVLADPDSGICEIPEIQEPAAGVIESLIPARKPRMSDFETSKLIGSGAFGAVYLVHHKDSRQNFAMKTMAKCNLDTPKKVELAFLERDILTFADCPFVVSMVCSFPTKSHLCMVMEHVGGGDCEILLRGGPLPVSLARLYFAEAVLAVEYLHSYGVVHRDLKPENLLITSAGHIKVADFGLSKVGVMIPKTNVYKQLTEDITREFLDYEVCGTPDYIAPEVLLQKGCGRPVDWWSMGIILYEFLVGYAPFYGDSVMELYRHIVSGDIDWDCNPVPPFPAQILITELLRKNPAHRLGTAGAFDIKGHPFLFDLDFDNLLSQKPEYVPQLVSDVINHSDINEHMVSEDEDHESLNLQNFTSSSERLSKLCTTATRTINNEDPKSPAECTPASSPNLLEMQTESFPVCNRDNAIFSLPFSILLSEFPAQEEKCFSINLSIEQQTSENEEEGKKRQELLAPEERKASINLTIEEQTSENEEKGEKKQEFPAPEERKSSINLSIEKQTSDNGEKRGRRRGSLLRRILSSCRRGLSRAARVFACCHSSPRTI
ncbi:microtubule-associated serine/threonine-protein kinase 1-like isoform X3 [Phyllobates terribilis]|uniref:microtubule-associated serine/threonine-protein kinase 1-like isoform X3 n=1 Tax=Phyllobates terribilis TaxID=111132 RepID=UPI003CCB0B55